MTVKTITIDGVIGTGSGEISSRWFAEQLPKDGSEINVRIHSEGGSVVEGFRIFDLASAYNGRKTCTIESAAYSIASFIPMAFDEVEIAPNGYMMLHNPYMGAEGDDEELAAKAEFLRKLKTNMVEAYAKKSGMSLDQVTSILKAESYLNAREVVAAGFADRMTSSPVIGRVFAKLDSMPHGVVAALFGAGSGGDTDSKKRGDLMSESKPVAATLEEIEAAFPKAKSDFVLSCLRKSLPMASVASAAVEEMMAENDELRAKVKAMEDEMMAKAAEITIEDDDEEDEMMAKAESEEEPEAMEEEEKPEAKAKTRGVRPVAKATTGSRFKTASARWKSEVDARVSKGVPRAKAIVDLDRDDPSLRAAMLAEFAVR